MVPAWRPNQSVLLAQTLVLFDFPLIESQARFDTKLRPDTGVEVLPTDAVYLPFFFPAAIPIWVAFIQFLKSQKKKSQDSYSGEKEE